MLRLGLRGFLIFLSLLFISFLFLWNANRWRFFRRRRFMYTRHNIVHYITILSIKENVLEPYYIHCSSEIICTRNVEYVRCVLHIQRIWCVIVAGIITGDWWPSIHNCIRKWLGQKIRVCHICIQSHLNFIWKKDCYPFALPENFDFRCIRWRIWPSLMTYRKNIEILEIQIFPRVLRHSFNVTMNVICTRFTFAFTIYSVRWCFLSLVRITSKLFFISCQGKKTWTLLIQLVQLSLINTNEFMSDYSFVQAGGYLIANSCENQLLFVFYSTFFLRLVNYIVN